MKYVNAHKILTFIPQKIQEEYGAIALLEHVVQALDFIGIPLLYKRKGCLLKVENNKSSLPEDLRFIDTIAFMEKSPSKEHVDQIITSYSTNKEYVDDKLITTSTKIVSKPHVSTNTASYDYVMRMQYTGVLNNYQLWEEEPFYNRHFSIIKHREDTKSAIHTSRCLSLKSYCAHNYSIDIDNTLRFSFSSGIVYLAYLALSLDDCNQLMVPNFPRLIQGLAKYVQYKVAEDKLWQSDQNGRYLYEKLQNEAELMLASARGEINMHMLDLEETDRVAHYIINPARSTMAFH